MGFTEQYTLANNSGFKQRVGIAMVTEAANAMGEDQGTMEPYEWSFRHKLAKGILNEPLEYIDRFTYAVVADPTILIDVLDPALQTRVGLVFPKIAGVGQDKRLGRM